ncbi:MAG: TonB-dependent receptor plug domain-containing protein [Betaproteobacteria bacterium]|nr:TonB-dependent receptor plug domain-containing protein [Betaproteobacteria bacterium]
MKLACIPLVAGLFVCTQPSANSTDLSELSLEELLKVSIIGASKYEQKQSEVAAAVSVITRKEIKAFGWRTLDEALASLPGMYTSYDRQYTSLGTRGFGVPGDFNTRILLTIDGNRVNDVVFDTALMGRAFPLDISLIERVEFIPGPGGAVYGQNALFGVVNVVTRSGQGVGGAELSAAYQSPQLADQGRATWGKDWIADWMFCSLRAGIAQRVKIDSWFSPAPGRAVQIFPAMPANWMVRKPGSFSPGWTLVTGHLISRMVIGARTTPLESISPIHLSCASINVTVTF